jgi:hypothetical protein
VFAKKVHGEVEIQLHSFLTNAREGGEASGNFRFHAPQKIIFDVY